MKKKKKKKMISGGRDPEKALPVDSEGYSKLVDFLFRQNKETEEENRKKETRRG